MASTFYLIVFIASLVMTMRFTLRNKKANSVFIVFAMLVVLNNLGRYLISVAGTTEMAIWANKLMYVGGCFVPMLLLFTLADLCKIKISGLLKFFMLLFPAVVMAFVLTIGHSDIYYREVELVIAEGGQLSEKDLWSCTQPVSGYDAGVRVSFAFLYHLCNSSQKEYLLQEHYLDQCAGGRYHTDLHF